MQVGQGGSAAVVVEGHQRYVLALDVRRVAGIGVMPVVDPDSYAVFRHKSPLPVALEVEEVHDGVPEPGVLQKAQCGFVGVDENFAALPRPMQSRGEIERAEKVPHAAGVGRLYAKREHSPIASSVVGDCPTAFSATNWA